MSSIQTIPALVVAGEVNAGPPLGPALGPLGVNIMSIVDAINEKTKDYKGMRVPVKIHVNTDNKEFDIEVGLPTTSALISKELGVSKGSGKPNEEIVGDLTLDQLLQISKSKIDSSYATTLKSVAKEVIGSCVSMGVKIEGLSAKDAIKKVDSGDWDDKLE